MNKKKRIAILFAVIIVAVGIIIAVTSHQKKEMDFDEFADRFEKSAEEVLGEDVKKVSKTELAATLTYGDQNDKDNNIYYRILKTTFYEGDPEEITGLHTEALGVLFPVDSMDSCEEMMIQDWPGALYKKDDTAFLCWTYSPEVTYAFLINEGASFLLFPVLSSCRYSESSQPSAWQSDIPASLSSPDDILHKLVFSRPITD